MTDLGPAPPGHRWVWLEHGWQLRPDPSATPTASPPVRQTGLGPFEMPARRNPPLSADRPAVVAAGEAVRRMR